MWQQGPEGRVTPQGELVANVQRRPQATTCAGRCRVALHGFPTSDRQPLGAVRSVSGVGF
jgi:hypothetical protein